MKDSPVKDDNNHSFSVDRLTAELRRMRKFKVFFPLNFRLLLYFFCQETN